MEIKRIYSGCRKCPYVDSCQHKQMEHHGYIDGGIAQGMANPVVEDMVLPMAVKHSYRDVKISEGVTVTIDLEDIKRRLSEDFYRGMFTGI